MGRPCSSYVGMSASTSSCTPGAGVAGGAGATLSPVARQVVDYYFDFHSNINTVENAYTLLK